MLHRPAAASDLTGSVVELEVRSEGTYGSLVRANAGYRLLLYAFAAPNWGLRLQSLTAELREGADSRAQVDAARSALRRLAEADSGLAAECRRVLDEHEELSLKIRARVTRALRTLDADASAERLGDLQAQLAARISEPQGERAYFKAAFRDRSRRGWLAAGVAIAGAAALTAILAAGLGQWILPSVLVWVGALVGTVLRFRAWPCPRCGERFSVGDRKVRERDSTSDGEPPEEGCGRCGLELRPS